MNVDIISPPRTIMEVFKTLPEGTLAELINGQIYMSPAPSNRHQRILKALLKIVDDYVEANALGEVLISPVDIFFDDHQNAVQPDLVFISHGNPNQPLNDEPFRGVPDILVEILSPGNDKHDSVTKKTLYEKFGVKEYWIIDPTSKESIVYQLSEKEYKLVAKNTATLFSPLFNQSFTY